MPAELDAAIEMIKKGKPDDARQTLVEVLRNNPHDENAWMWLASVVEEDNHRRECLERALAINPANKAAGLELERLSRNEPPLAEKLTNTPLPAENDHKPTILDEVVETRLVTLACPSCGASLEITPDRDLFVCPSCGNSHVVKRSAGMVALEPVLEQMREMQERVVRSSREMTIHHLNDEIQALQEAKKPHKNGITDGMKITVVGVVILLFLNMGFYLAPLVYLGIGTLAVGLGWISYHFIKQRQIEAQIQLKRLEISRQ